MARKKPTSSAYQLYPQLRRRSDVVIDSTPIEELKRFEEHKAARPIGVVRRFSSVQDQLVEFPKRILDAAEARVTDRVHKDIGGQIGPIPRADLVSVVALALKAPNAGELAKVREYFAGPKRSVKLARRTRRPGLESLARQLADELRNPPANLPLRDLWAGRVLREGATVGRLIEDLTALEQVARTEGDGLRMKRGENWRAEVHAAINLLIGVYHKNKNEWPQCKKDKFHKYHGPLFEAVKILFKAAGIEVGRKKNLNAALGSQINRILKKYNEK